MIFSKNWPYDPTRLERSSYYNKNKASRSTKTWCLVPHSFSCPHQDATLTGNQFLVQKPQKCKKPVKIHKIRYKYVITKIRYIKKVKIDFKSAACVPVSLTP
jgi:hypothetical protein